MTTDYLLGQPLDLSPVAHLLAHRDLIEDPWNIEWQLGRSNFATGR